MNFDMKCPECGANRWKLTHKGENEFTKTEDVTTLIGEYGRVIITCRKCKFVHEIWIGSD